MNHQIRLIAAKPFAHGIEIRQVEHRAGEPHNKRATITRVFFSLSVLARDLHEVVPDKATGARDPGKRVASRIHAALRESKVGLETLGGTDLSKSCGLTIVATISKLQPGKRVRN